MQLLKRASISLLISFVILTIICFVYAILLYNNKLDASSGAIYKFSLLIGALVFFILGIMFGKTSKNKTFFKSLLFATLIVIVLIIIKLISKETLALPLIIKYIIYVLSSSIGGIISGINIRKKRIH